MHQVPAMPKAAGASARCPSAPGATSSPTRWSRSAPAVRTWSRSPPRCCIPVGLAPFAAAFPDRVYDVGIAEQHALTSAAGLALGGLHPVVALYSTFLNRAFDQLLMDVALHGLPVTVTLDRAGVTGPDGASHNGMWDGSILQVVPGLRIAAPRDGSRIAELLNEAVDVTDGPTVLRWPKGERRRGGRGDRQARRMDVLAEPAERPGPRRAAHRRRADVGHLRRGRRAPGRPRASASPSSTRAGSSRSTRPW